jgi:hypothetical protein
MSGLGFRSNRKRLRQEKSNLRARRSFNMKFASNICIISIDIKSPSIHELRLDEVKSVWNEKVSIQY